MWEKNIIYIYEYKYICYIKTAECSLHYLRVCFFVLKYQACNNWGNVTIIVTSYVTLCLWHLLSETMAADVLKYLRNHDDRRLRENNRCWPLLLWPWQKYSLYVFSSLLSKDPSMLYDIRLKYTKMAVGPTESPTFWNGAVLSAVPGYSDENVSESNWGIQKSQESRQSCCKQWNKDLYRR